MLQSIPHQIVQSPARLGLPNPNSPSLTNTNPSKFSTQASSHQPLPPPAIAAPVSSALLPLLPPLPRAQTLLLQMATLAARLFEVSPNRTHWVASFRGSLPSFLSAPQTQPHSPASTKEILAQFAALQTQLFESVAELQEILDLQDAKNKLAREIKSKDSSLLDFATKLKDVEHSLDTLVDDYSDYRRPKRVKLGEKSPSASTTTIETTLKLSDVLSYAHKISYTTFAPPEFGSSQGPLRGALPPAPQDEQMRASQLYGFADLDVGLPETEGIRERIVEPMIEAPGGGEMAGIGGLIPLANIVIPSGWRPGMPVELSSDLPMLPPPWWKPGDPVPLPPLDLLPHVVPAAAAVQQPRPAVLPVSGRGPETIQVRHVQLDFDDDSSAYSSDEGSSESDD